MAKPLFKARNLTKHFEITQSFLQKLRMKEAQKVRAVDGIDFDIYWKRNFSIVGESGCGKTTVGKLMMRLLKETDGKMYMKGKDITEIDSKQELKAYRRQTQIIYQDPFSALDPRDRIRTILEEPLLVHDLGDTREERSDMIYEALEEVRLTPPEKFLRRYPHMLSGGQKQRVSLARAMILNPDFIVCDEPVSMLDVSVRAEVLNLMKDLIEEEDVTYFYITHDISTTRFFTDYIGVMYLGDLVEKGKVSDVLDDPAHPYTQALLVAVPEADPERGQEVKELPISGEIPSGTNVPSGCRFHPRCPHAEDICSEEEPPEKEVGSEHTAKCHFAGEIDFDIEVA
ncbi:MAG: ABC transporter ATP-binding protein [Candidatus Thermoplasmatota archaeon]